LLVAVAGRGVTNDLPFQIVQGRKQRDRPMPVVVVSLSRNLAHPQGQTWLRALQGLTLALLIAAQNQGFLGRVQVQSHHIPKLLLKVFVVLQLEVPPQVWLQFVGSSPSVDFALRYSR